MCLRGSDLQVPWNVAEEAALMLSRMRVIEMAEEGSLESVAGHLAASQARPLRSQVPVLGLVSPIVR